MTGEEAKSCIDTIEMLQKLAYSIHGIMDGIDADNCKKIIKALEQELTPKDNLAVDCNCISRVQAQTEIQMHASRYTIAKERGGMGQVEWSDQLIKVSDAIDIIRNLPSVTPTVHAIPLDKIKQAREKMESKLYAGTEESTGLPVLDLGVTMCLEILDELIESEDKE